MIMDEKLQTTLNKVIQLTKQNPEFGSRLRKALEIEPSASPVYDRSVPENIKAIRSALEIRGNYSIDYSFIDEEQVYNQLYADNLRMENAALNLQMSENARFYMFCINAFYQIENVLNYFYHKKFPKISDLVNEIVEGTKKSGVDGEYAYRPSGKEKTVSDIHIASKLNAFCNNYFPGDNIGRTLYYLRLLRNEGEHRCMIIFLEKDEENQLYRFFKYNSIANVRDLLMKLVSKVKQLLASTSEMKPTVEMVEVTVKMDLPSGLFVEVNGDVVSLPNKFFAKVCNCKKGDRLRAKISDGKIIDVSELSQ